MIRKFDVAFHFDVWGNAEDGWQVNDSSRQGTIEVPDGASTREVWNALVEAGIAQGSFDDAKIEDLGEDYEINDAKDGRPVFFLQSVV